MKNNTTQIFIPAAQDIVDLWLDDGYPIIDLTALTMTDVHNNAIRACMGRAIQKGEYALAEDMSTWLIQRTFRGVKIPE